MNRKNLILGLAATLITVGVGFVYWPAGLIAAGGLLILLYDF